METIARLVKKPIVAVVFALTGFFIAFNFAPFENVLPGTRDVPGGWRAQTAAIGGIAKAPEPEEPSDLMKIAGFVPGLSNAKRLVVSGNIAYVANDQFGLTTVDISNPDAPRILGSSDVFFDGGNMAYANGVASVVGYFSEYTDYRTRTGELKIIILDVSDPSRPAVRSKINNTGSGHLAMNGRYLYFLNPAQNMRVFDLSNPANPTETSTSIDFGAGTVSMTVSGNYLYVAGGTDGFAIFDLSSPANPVLVSSLRGVPELNNVTHVAVSGNSALVMSGNTLRSINIGNPSAPTLNNLSLPLGIIGGISVSENVATVARSGNGLEIVDISPGKMQSIGNYSVFSGGSVAHVKTIGDMSYIATPRGLGVISNNVDLAQGRASPTLRSSVANHYASTNKVTVSPRDAVAITNGINISQFDLSGQNFTHAITVYNISDPARPRVVKKIPIFTVINNMAFSENGGYAFISSGNKILVYGFSDPFNPAFVAETTVTGAAGRMVINGNRMYATNGTGGILIFNIANPAAPAAEGSVDTPGSAVNMALSEDGRYAFIADTNSLQVADTGTKTIVGSNPGIQGETMNGISVKNDLLYLGGSGGTVKIFDISNPVSPVAKGSVDSPVSQSRNVQSIDALYAPTVFFTSNQGGFHAANTSEPSSPLLLNSAQGTPTSGNDPGVGWGVVKNGWAYLADSKAGLLTVNVASLIPVGDSTPPSRRNPSPAPGAPPFFNVTSALVSLETNEPATCKWSPTSGVSYGSMTSAFTTTGGANHSMTITFDQSRQDSRSFYIRCQDQAGNANTTDFLISFGIVGPAVSITRALPDAPLPSGTTETTVTINTNRDALDAQGESTCRWSGLPNTLYADMTGRFSITAITGQYATTVPLPGAVSRTIYIRCADTFGNAALSDYVFPITVGTPSAVAPSITSQPSNVSVTQGASAIFSVTAAGTAPLSYQWQRNGSDIPGAIDSRYTLLNAFVTDSGAQFRCRVTNSAGQVFSSAATLTVNPPPQQAPTISAQPNPITVNVGQSATFSVTAAGTAPLSYQWQKNGADISGATSASYTLQNSSLSDSGAQFRVRVSNGAGSVTSASATLTVVTTPIPPNINSNPVSVAVLAGASATFSVTAFGSAPLTYQWQRRTSPTAPWQDISGAVSASYTLANTVIADSGSQFKCRVANSAGSLTSDPATLTVTAPLPPSITSEPSSVSIAPGGTVRFTVAAAGTPPLSFQWQRRASSATPWQNISGATSASYALANVARADSGAQFRCRVSNTALPAEVFSRAALLTVTGGGAPKPREGGFIESDADGDGVGDSIDVCPSVPGLRGSVNGFGCPLPRATTLDIQPDFNSDDSDLRSMTGVELGNSAFGRISYGNQSVRLMRGTGTGANAYDRLDLDRGLSFTQNRVSLDSVLLPELNLPATVTLYRVTVQTPILMKDGVACAECRIVSYQNGTLVFTVPHFTTYEVREGAVTIPPPPPPGGGGGGGGSGYYVPPQTPSSSPTSTAGVALPPSGAPGVLFFTKNLRVGSVSQDVYRLQRFLNAHGFAVAQNGPGSRGRETLRFGAGTKGALIRFQERYALEILAPTGLNKGTGIFGPNTRAKANSIISGEAGVPVPPVASQAPPATASTPVNSPPSIVRPPAAISPAVPKFTIDLRLGSEHAQVKELQKFLNTHGFMVARSGPGSRGKETSAFDKAVYWAVVRFQEAHLDVLRQLKAKFGNGIFGAETRQKANEMLRAERSP